MLPLAALARLAGAGVSGFGAAEAAVARSAVASRGTIWRSAMQEAGGNKAMAREMVNQKASDVREQQRDERQRMQEEARENARQLRQQQEQSARVRSSWTPPVAKQFMGGLASGDFTVGGQIANQAQTQIIGDNYRGLATSVLPGPLGKYLESFARLAEAIDARAREIAPFSGRISQSVAMTGVRSTYANMYEAQVAGDSYARVVDELNRVDTTLQEGFAPIKDEIAKNIGDILSVVADLARDVAPTLKQVADVMMQMRVINQQLGVAIVRLSHGDRTGAGNALGKELDKRIEDEREERERKLRKDSDPFAELFKNPLLLMPPEAPATHSNRPPGDGWFGNNLGRM